MAKDPHKLSWTVGKEECSAGRNIGRPPFNSKIQIIKGNYIVIRERKTKRRKTKKDTCTY